MPLSWSVRCRGSVEDLRRAAHAQEVDQAGYRMPRSERLAVNHLLGHAIEGAAEIAATNPLARFEIEGYGHENPDGSSVDHHVTMRQVEDAAPPDAETAP